LASAKEGAIFIGNHSVRGQGREYIAILYHSDGDSSSSSDGIIVHTRSHMLYWKHILYHNLLHLLSSGIHTIAVGNFPFNLHLIQSTGIVRALDFSSVLRGIL
jgi:hypothetical protein